MNNLSGKDLCVLGKLQINIRSQNCSLVLTIIAIISPQSKLQTLFAASFSLRKCFDKHKEGVKPEIFVSCPIYPST